MKPTKEERKAIRDSLRLLRERWGCRTQRQLVDALRARGVRAQQQQIPGALERGDAPRAWGLMLAALVRGYNGPDVKLHLRERAGEQLDLARARFSVPQIAEMLKVSTSAVYTAMQVRPYAIPPAWGPVLEKALEAPQQPIQLAEVVRLDSIEFEASQADVEARVKYLWPNGQIVYALRPGGAWSRIQ